VSRQGGLIQRFTLVERITHWLVAITFILLLLSGFGLSYPRLSWLTTVLGGGTMARVLHPWVGLVFTAGIVAMILLWVGSMWIGERDRAWLRAIRSYVTREHDRVPPAGRYNAGQKLYYWLQIGLALLFLVSGLPLWWPDLVSAGVFNTSRLIHFLSALLGAVSLVPHVYLATLAYPGTFRSMVDGTVSRRWARHHHPLWRPEDREAGHGP
jgi:formate dehydrogenase subunit gamma